MDDEQELPKVTTRNTPISMGTTSIAKDPNPQSPTEPNHMVRNTPGRTSKVSKNLDFETNYIDPTTAMTATESNVLIQTDQNHPLPSSSAQPVTERPASMPLDETHQIIETSSKGNDVDNANSKPPQSNSIEDNIPNSTPRPELVPGTIEESKPNTIGIESGKAEGTTPKSEPSESSNSDLGPGAIAENTLESQPKPEDGQDLKEMDKSDGEPITQSSSNLLNEIENKPVEIPSATQEVSVDMKTEAIPVETNQEAIPVSTAAIGGTENSESAIESVSTPPSLSIANTPTNGNEESSPSVQSTSNADEINKSDSTPTVGVIEESKVETIPESTIGIPEEKEKIDEPPNTIQSNSADSEPNPIEKPSSPAQPETQPQSDNDVIITTASPKSETVAAATTNAVTEAPPAAPSTPTINDNEHIQETSPPIVSTHTEHVNAEMGSSHLAEQEAIEINKPTPPASPPQPSIRPNTKDENSNEPTNDKIIEESEKASATTCSSIKLILLGCMVLVPYSHQYYVEDLF